MSNLELFIKRCRKIARELKLSRKITDGMIDSLVQTESTTLMSIPEEIVKVCILKWASAQKTDKEK